MNKKNSIKVITGLLAVSMLGLVAVNGGQTGSGRVAFAEGTEAENEIASPNEARREASIMNDADKIYGVGSVSKVYVTTAVMQLVEQGKVDPDAPMTDYIDDFKMADVRYKDITVRMLMNHTS